MAKLRLTQPGFESYTAQMGVLFFKDGLSTTDVSPNDARRMAAVMRCEWEGGGDPSNAQLLLDSQERAAPIFTADGQGTDADKEAAEARDKAAVVASLPDTPATSVWSRDKLEAIADKEGMAGLRAIAEPMGLKGTSIVGLIAAILSAPAPESM